MPDSPYAQAADWNGGTPGTPRLTRAVLWLLALNVGVYFVQQTVQQNLPVYLGFGGLGKLLEGEWWTLGTYMFVHGGFWHLAFNMYALWMFGPRLEEAWGTRPFTWYYLWCGLGGVMAHLAFVRGPSLLVGASGAIFGLLLAFAVRWPNEEVLFFGLVPMKMKWFALFLGAINLVSGAVDVTTGGSGVSHLAHLGGFVFGALWLARPAVPDVEHLRRRVSPAPDVTDGLPRAVPPRGTPRPRERGSAADEAVERSRALTTPPPLPTIVPPPPPAPPRAPRPARAAERGAAATPPAKSGPPTGPAEGRPAAPALAAPTAASRREVLDRLLDKISADGIASLTGEERRLLEETSRSLRDQ